MFFGPITGLSFIISLLVLLIGLIIRPFIFIASKPVKLFSPARKKSKPLMAAALIVFTFTLYASVTTFVIVETAKHPRTTMLAFASTFIPCDELYVSPSEHNVILRLDDVQAYGWSDVSIRMMDDAISNDMPIVAGIIPKDLADDKKLVNFLERESCNIEFALHGYDHGAISDFDEVIGEFEALTYDVASEKLKIGIDEIEKDFNNNITTFIPPQNRISLEATAALEEYNLYLSKSGKGYYDYDAKTWNYDDNEPISAIEVMKTCDTVFKNGDNLCVIMLHPQDFIDEEGKIDEGKYSEYKKLLSLIDLSEFSTVRFSDMIALHSSK